MSSELFSIMPNHTLSQEERDFRCRASLDLPGFRQFSNETLEVSVIFDQAIEDEGVDVAGGRILGKDGIEKGGVADRTDDQLVDLLGRPGADENNIDPQEDKKKDGKDAEKRFDPQRKPLSMAVHFQDIIEEKSLLHNIEIPLILW